MLFKNNSYIVTSMVSPPLACHLGFIPAARCGIPVVLVSVGMVVAAVSDLIQCSQ